MARRAHDRANIARKVRDLRKERHWTQAELAQRLGLSQNRLSEIERGKGSFTAEQFLTILKLFNVPLTHFASERRPSSEVQNTLARLGAVHLRENPDVLPSELFEEAGDAIREVLIAAESSRHITALAPVLVHNIDRINLKKLDAQFIEIGLERRFAWLIANTLAALHDELGEKLPRDLTGIYRRGEVVLGAFLTGDIERRLPRAVARPTDILDPDIRSAKTLKEVESSRSAISRRWGIATGLQPEDFVNALRASRVSR